MEFSMDMQTGLICAGLVVLSGAVLLLVSLFGIKETTYEEAIAEQRKMPDGALLLRRAKQDKSKDKKPKRVGKKVKEKKKEVVTRQSSSETDDQPVSEQEHAHVTIQPEAVVLGENESAHAEEKKKKKKEKVKPILVNREKTVADNSVAEKAPAANNFEETIPKDDLTLRKLSKSEITTNEAPKKQASSEAIKFVTANHSEGPVEKNSANESDEKDLKQKSDVKTTKAEKLKEVAKSDESISSSSTPVDSSPVQQSKAAKEKKKAKKSDVSSLQLIGDVNLQLLSTLIRKAELSRNEVQSLTDLLLNKHLDDRIDHSEWIEGRQDPVVKLKKQLAEKEEALANETASSLAFQNKLKELRAELNAERSKLSQTCRSYDEGLIAKQSELQNLQSRLHQQTLHFENEKQAMVQKMQQLNLQMKDDGLRLRKLQESGQSQQQEVINYRQQIQQMEVHIKRLSDAENTLKGQFHAAMSEREQLSASYNSELQKSRHLEEELRDALGKLEAAKETSLEHEHGRTKQLEDLEREKKDLEKMYNDAGQAAEDLQNRLQKEIHHLTNKVSELLAENDEQRKDNLAEKNRLKNEINTLAGVVTEAQAEVDRLKNDREKVSSAATAAAADTAKVVEQNKCLQDEVAFFKKEKERLTAELTSLQRTPADGRENDAKDLNTQFINYENEAGKKDTLLEKLRGELKVRDSLVEKLGAEITGYTSELSKLNTEVTKLKTDISSLTQELEAQKNKNNDLRQKNWKAVDALSIAEKALDNKNKETDKIVNTQTAQVRGEEQRVCKELLERLFPEVRIGEKDYKKWTASFESSAQQVLSDLRAVSATLPTQDVSSEKLADLESRNSQLQDLVSHYKTIIEDTEGMLNKLQNHVEVEEIRWNEKLQTKQSEVDSLKQEHSSLIDSLKSQASLEGVEFAYNCIEKTLPELLNQMSEKIKYLESELAKSQKESDGKREGEYVQRIAELQELENANKEKILAVSKEKDLLESKLNSELERIKELNKELVKLRSNLKIGQDSYEAEHKLRLELEEKMAALGCRSSGDSTSGVNNITENIPHVVERNRSSEPSTAAIKKKGIKQKRQKPRKSSWGLSEWFRKVRPSSKKSRRLRTEP